MCIRDRLDSGSATWVPLPMGAELGFAREYWEPGATPPTKFPDFPVLTMSGHRVWKTRERYEDESGVAWYPDGGWSRAWLSPNFSLLAYLDLSLIHISEPTRLGMISYAVFCLKKKK